jgi:hypothetical protein
LQSNIELKKSSWVTAFFKWLMSIMTVKQTLEQ